MCNFITVLFSIALTGNIPTLKQNLRTLRRQDLLQSRLLLFRETITTIHGLHTVH